MHKPKEKLIGRSADEWSEKLWERILEGVANSRSKKEVQKFLESILSERERTFLLRRLAILALIQSGKSYKEIGEILWVSPQTVSTIKKNFSGNTGRYRGHKKLKGGARNKRGESVTSSVTIDFIFNFLSIPVKVFEAFLTKGIGVKGDSGLGLNR